MATTAKAPSPQATVKALKMLGADYDLSRYAPEAAYGKRMQIFKALHSTVKVLAKINTYANLVQQLFAAVGLAMPTPRTAAKQVNAMRAEFAARCQLVLKTAAKEAAKTRKAAREETVTQLARAVKVVVPSTGKPILPGKRVRATDKRLRAEQEKAKEILAAQIAAKPKKPVRVTTPAPLPEDPKERATEQKRRSKEIDRRAEIAAAETPITQKPDTAPTHRTTTKWGAELKDGHMAQPADLRQPPVDVVQDPTAPMMVPAEVALVEHKNTGVVLLRLALAGTLGGFPCVYNNGREVRLGIVSLDTMSQFRIVEADVIQAAQQLLHPFIASIPVNPVAASHLAAVTNCKEIIQAMAKFAAPATTTKKSTETTTKSAVKSAPAKGAAKKAVAEKPAKAPKKGAPAAGKKPSMYTGVKLGRLAGRKIKVLNKVHGAREGTKRAIGMDIILKHKDTDAALAALIAAGCDATYFKHAVAAGLVELV